MLNIRNAFPAFSLKSVRNGTESEFPVITNDTYRGKWLIAFFYPKDFTFVCPTEIRGFGDLHKEFRDRGAEVLGLSTDSEFVHAAWMAQKEELSNLPFPLASDIKRELSNSLGILDSEEGVALRATYIVDPEGIIRYVSVNDMNVGRNPKEVLRILDALQTDELCPCNWEKGQKTINGK